MDGTTQARDAHFLFFAKTSDGTGGGGCLPHVLQIGFWFSDMNGGFVVFVGISLVGFGLSGVGISSMGTRDSAAAAGVSVAMVVESATM